jgi:hypothetical protein
MITTGSLLIRSPLIINDDQEVEIDENVLQVVVVVIVEVEVVVKAVIVIETIVEIVTIGELLIGKVISEEVEKKLVQVDKVVGQVIVLLVQSCYSRIW